MHWALKEGFLLPLGVLGGFRSGFRLLQRTSLLAFFLNPDFCAKRLGLNDVKRTKMMDAFKSIYYPDEDFDWHEI